MNFSQPPSGGCVLKRFIEDIAEQIDIQPPSGGCVLKHIPDLKQQLQKIQPPSGGCVLKLRLVMEMENQIGASRLRAAVC